MKTTHPIVLAVLLAPLAAPGARAQTTRESLASDGAQANDFSDGPSDVSADGRFVAFMSAASNLVPDDHNTVWDIFVRDRETGSTVRASVASDGSEASHRCSSPAITPDGRYVAFVSDALNLVPGDNDRLPDVFRHDLVTGETICVSVQPDGTPVGGGDSNLSADGRFVAFSSLSSKLVAGDTNDKTDVFRRDCTTGETIRISLANDGGEAQRNSSQPRMSADGNLVAFFSEAGGLDGSGVLGYCIYLRDVAQGTTELVSVGQHGELPNGNCLDPSITADGAFVTFTSHADDLVDGDENDAWDVFVRDRAESQTMLLSRTAGGTAANGDSGESRISADGRTVAFESLASDIVDDDTNGKSDVFVVDLYNFTFFRASTRTGMVEAHGASHWPSISGDGSTVAFVSAADDLVDGDTNFVSDLFSFHRSSAPARWDLYGSGYAGKSGEPSIALDDLPRLPSRRALLLGSSTDLWTYGFVYCGLQSTSLPTRLGGTLLVLPNWVFPLAAPPAGSQLLFDLPLDYRLAGLPFYFQWIEADHDAPHGASFSAGLEMVPGA
jgi:Tol biopolymer transport system component